MKSFYEMLRILENEQVKTLGSQRRKLFGWQRPKKSPDKRYGTASSGNWGHQGRPGVGVGGSGDGGGSIDKSSVLTDAVATWKGDPSILRVHVQNEIDGKPLPADAGKRLKNRREMAKELLKAVREKSEPAPTLYRGDKIKSSDNPSPILGWTSSKKIAEEFASANGGEVEVLDNVKGLNLSKYTDADLERGEDEWIVENHHGGGGHKLEGIKGLDGDVRIKVVKDSLEESRPIFNVYHQGNKIASFKMSGQGDYISDADVLPQYRRKGVATKAYDFIEDYLNIKLTPSTMYQTQDGKDFWKTRIPKTAKNSGKRYGTASSGNYGHQGRPGEVGGSGEGGAAQPNVMKMIQSKPPTVRSSDGKNLTTMKTTDSNNIG